METLMLASVAENAGLLTFRVRGAPQTSGTLPRVLPVSQSAKGQKVQGMPPINQMQKVRVLPPPRDDGRDQPILTVRYI